MNIIYNYLCGPGEPYVESRGTKVSSYWRHKYNEEQQWIISFSYVKTLTSLAIWGPEVVGLQ